MGTVSHVQKFEEGKKKKDGVNQTPNPRRIGFKRTPVQLYWGTRCTTIHNPYSTSIQVSIQSKTAKVQLLCVVIVTALLVNVIE